jgi:hypothetical protein
MNIESVWEYPRPPQLEPVPQGIRVRLRDAWLNPVPYFSGAGFEGAHAHQCAL